MYIQYILLFLHCSSNQSRNWDGGAQERDTAISCIRQVFPTAKIASTCVDAYPIRVVIVAHDNNNSEESSTNNGNKDIKCGVLIWEGDQKALFRKYGARRQKAMEDIVHKLNVFKSSRL